MCLSLNAEYMEISKVNHHEWPVVNMPVCNCCCLNCRVMTRALSFNANSKLTRLLIIPHPSHTLCGIFSGRLSTCHCHRPQSLNRPQGLHHDNVRNTKSKKLSGVVLAGWGSPKERPEDPICDFIWLEAGAAASASASINSSPSPPHPSI